MTALATTNTRVMLVEADNVGSKQMAEIRLALRGKATILMGKNTMIKTCLRKLIDSNASDYEKLTKLVDMVKENVGLVFCHVDPSEIRDIIIKFRVPAPAKLGALAPVDVHVPPGGTGMDPGQTSFFQTLGIATKIVKGQIEIQNEIHIIKAGERVTASQAVLLNKLSIRPFSYGLKCGMIYDDGQVYPASVLDISAEDMQASVVAAIRTIAALSLGTNVPNKASAPHSIINAYKQVAGLALALDYKFPQLEAAMKNAASAPAAGPAKAATGAAPAKVEKEESEPEEDDDMGFSLFD